MRFIHEDVYGKFDPVRDVRDLYGVRYFPAVERGRNGTKRLHAHVLITGGDLLGNRLARARWTPWREWWNREYGGLVIDQPREQGDVAAYCTKYVLKGDDAGFELRSTWADERDWRKRAEAPLLEQRKVGMDVTRSAELEKSAYHGDAPNGCAPASKGSGRVCHRCGLVSLCRCSIGTAESGQVLTTPESDAGACEGSAKMTPALPSPQIELRMQQQLVLPAHASANKSCRFSSRREKYLQRRRDYEFSRQVSSNTASKLSSGN